MILIREKRHLSACGYLCCDRLNDFAFSIHRGEIYFKTQSIINFDPGERKFEKGESDLTTFGFFNILQPRSLDLVE
jgi:hypothetical protein